jgi:hypothetical protein
MRRYRPNAASPIRIDYGIGLVAGLNHFSQTKSLAGNFEELNNELDAAYTTRRSKRNPLVKARQAVRFGNFEVDNCIRQSARALEIAGGGRRGTLFWAIMPNGLEPIIAPAGRRQIKPTEALIDRIERCKLEEIHAFRDEWLPKLKAALAVLVEAAKAYQAAFDAFTGAFKEEAALRDEHFFGVDKLMGLVRAAFPGDKARQDLVFPAVDDGGEGGTVEEEDDGGEGSDPK